MIYHRSLLFSWLLSDENMKLRSTHQPYMSAVKCYFEKLLPLVTDLQVDIAVLLCWASQVFYEAYIICRVGRRTSKGV